VHWLGNQFPHRKDDLSLTFRQTCSGFGCSLLTEESRTQQRDDMQNLPSGAQALHPSRQEALQREYPSRDDPPGRMRREPAANVWCRMR
jgi:hypothetical protein